MAVHGVAVTTPLRTALDLACNLRAPEALSALDSFARLHGVGQAEMLAEMGRFRGRRGVVQARHLVGMMDPRAESARESRLRMAIRDAGLPTPQSQYVVMLDGLEFRLDFAYPAHRVAIEYDGAEFHDAEEQRQRDEFRRNLLAGAGWTVIVVRRRDFTGPRLDAWVAQVREALDGRYTSLRW